MDSKRPSLLDERPFRLTNPYEPSFPPSKVKTDSEGVSQVDTRKFIPKVVIFGFIGFGILFAFLIMAGLVFF